MRSLCAGGRIEQELLCDFAFPRTQTDAVTLWGCTGCGRVPWHQEGKVLDKAVQHSTGIKAIPF